MPASTQSVRVGNLADLRALQVERERIEEALRRISERERATIRVILAQEQTGRIQPLRAVHLMEVKDAA